MTMRIIAGAYKGRKIKTPKETITRPTQAMVREAIFNICQNEIGDAHFLDLFAGSGAMGLEALSRGAQQSTFIEQNKGALLCIKENIKLLELEKQTKVLPMNIEKGIQKLIKEDAHFHLIYVDPPYHTPFDLFSIEPLLESSSLIFLETGKKLSQEIPHSLNLVSLKKFGASHIAILSN